MNTTNTKFKQWLAGLIDGNGCFLLSKKGYASLEITMSQQDAHALQQIKQKYGGSVKQRSGVAAVRYRLHHKDGLLQLQNDVNGQIRHSTRYHQFSRLCVVYGINPVSAISLTSKQDSWVSGFFDADGTVTLNKLTHQISISISQKDRYLLDPLVPLFGGNVYADMSRQVSYKWYISNEEDLNNFIKYLKENPSRSSKKGRQHLIPQLLELKKQKAHLAPADTVQAKAWFKLKAKFDRYGLSTEDEV